MFEKWRVVVAVISLVLMGLDLWGVYRIYLLLSHQSVLGAVVADAIIFVLLLLLSAIILFFGVLGVLFAAFAKSGWRK
ncbi:hypothetical protein B9Q03_07895 [Candidatus Marsarchaeota G2 archaeon OSP_D]|jgi:hypothetical protein|uniref:Uncharacterized protein n=2 Tax=Candidatus Marsarchaeota group 2 TaxID=2203771 RepID=A0A2R6C7E2_9ARCH|nr:MAG: hypothetical protein B9Q03_07895 [Candidatus Marsarchaeota G2 archaeon OSP_D]PSO06797.1 MAG: hypothetical protein B9Q04_14215 [Candidatus Marsarchaeota G2 archaeon BE_D]